MIEPATDSAVMGSIIAWQGSSQVVRNVDNSDLGSSRHEKREDTDVNAVATICSPRPGCVEFTQPPLRLAPLKSVSLILMSLVLPGNDKCMQQSLN
jgi:hypothetical protein